jgi:hypothetical protein
MAVLAAHPAALAPNALPAVPSAGTWTAILALISMTIDHVTIAASPGGLIEDLGRGVGRCAFPLFLALLLAGWHRTRDRKAYTVRILIFALVSQGPFILAWHGLPLAALNIGFGLLAALGVLALGSALRRPWDGVSAVAFTVGAVVLAVFAEVAGVDYGAAGVFAVTAGMLGFSHGPWWGRVLLITPIIVLAAAAGWWVPVAAAPAVLGMLGVAAWLDVQRPLAWRLPSWLWYGFYPGHLLIIAAWRWAAVL